MTKSKAYTFHNIFVFLILLSLFGCGNTRIKPSQEVEIISGNSVNAVVKEFKLTRLLKVSDFEGLPNEFNRFKNQLNQFDFYYAQAPTQKSGGFVFEVISNPRGLVICLKKPDPLSSVTTALTNPIALIQVKRGLIVNAQINYCN